MRQRKKIDQFPQRFHIETRTIQSTHEKEKLFLDVFSYTSENINQRKLGTLFAVFSIYSHKKDTEYITSRLASVAKKEYFSKPKRSVAESFEAMLNRINLVLGEIAKEGAVSWMGSLDGVICAISKDDLYFSTSGQGNLFLKRKDMFLNLSETDEEEKVSHPLKTFQDIASGKILENDILILSERHLFEVFSPEDLEKELDYLSFEEFSQMIQTALINECPLAGVILGRIKKDIHPSALTEKLSSSNAPNSFSQDINLFGKDAYKQKPKRSPQPTVQPQKEKQKASFSTTSREDYIDTKTGEIYVNQKSDTSYNKSSFQKRCDHWREYFFDLYDSLQPFINARKKQLRHFLRKKHPKSPIQDSPVTPPSQKEDSLDEIAKDPTSPEKPFAKKALLAFEYTKKTLSKIISKTKKQGEKIIQSTKSNSKKKNLFSFLLPNISLIKNLVKNFCYEQRVLAISFLLIIVIVPFLFLFNPFKKKTSDPPTPSPQEAQEEITQEDIVESKTFWEEKWEQEKNVTLFQEEDSFTFVSSRDIQPIGEIIDSFWWNNTLLLVQEKEIITYNTETKERSIFPFTESSSPIVLSTFMSDLSLIFLLTEENALYTFSPVSKKFEENTLPKENTPEFALLGSYLTYLYTLDETNRILRFPRTEGGFSDPTEWLEEDEIFPKDPKIWYIQGSVYVSNGKNSLNTLFGGTLTDFSLEETFVPLASIESLFVTENEEMLFILDSGEGRILVVNAENGSVQKNFVSNSFQGAQKILSADNEFIYLLDKENSLLRIPIS